MTNIGIREIVKKGLISNFLIIHFTHTLGSQHPEAIHATSAAPSSWRNADLREDVDRKDDHPRGSSI